MYGGAKEQERILLDLQLHRLRFLERARRCLLECVVALGGQRVGGRVKLGGPDSAEEGRTKLRYRRKLLLSRGPEINSADVTQAGTLRCC